MALIDGDKQRPSTEDAAETACWALHWPAAGYNLQTARVVHGTLIRYGMARHRVPSREILNIVYLFAQKISTTGLMGFWGFGFFMAEV